MCAFAVLVGFVSSVPLLLDQLHTESGHVLFPGNMDLGGYVAREAVRNRLAVLIDSVLGKSTWAVVSHFFHAVGWEEREVDGYTYWGARVVLRKVNLQITHWISLAASFCGDRWVLAIREV